MTDELTIWQPSPFDGSDLLPVNTHQNDLEVVGDDDIDDSDIVLPTLKMLQGTAVNEIEGAKAGQFYNTVTKQLYDGPIRVLVISHSKGNSYFPEEGSQDKACYSLDGVEGTEYGLCSECRKNEWDRSVEPHKKPLCNKQHKIIVMTPDGPALMRFQSTSYRALDGLLTQKKMLRKNFFDHPAIIKADGPHKGTKNGKTFTYYTLVVQWATNEEIPLHVRKTALETFKGLRDAQSHGRLKGADDNDRESESTSKVNTETNVDYGDIPF